MDALEILDLTVHELVLEELIFYLACEYRLLTTRNQLARRTLILTDNLFFNVIYL